MSSSNYLHTGETCTLHPLSTLSTSLKSGDFAAACATLAASSEGGIDETAEEFEPLKRCHLTAVIGIEHRPRFCDRNLCLRRCGNGLSRLHRLEFFMRSLPTFSSYVRVFAVVTERWFARSP